MAHLNPTPSALSARPPEQPRPGAAFIPVTLSGVDVHRPLPVDILNERGTLLLAKGLALETLDRQLALSRHAPVIRAEDRDLWLTMLRPHARRQVPSVVPVPMRLRTGVPRLAQDERFAPRPDAPPRARTADNNNVVSAWLDVHAAWRVLLYQPAQTRDFLGRFERVRDKAWQLLSQQVDGSLFALVQMLYDLQASYSTSNALTAAALCRIVGTAADLPEADQRATFNAALTMNLGMARLQDQLREQRLPPTVQQSADIQRHPHHSRDMLMGLGVKDEQWLNLVADSHESALGGGYPTGKQTDDPLLMLLQLADRLVARISPRHSRQGMSVRLAMRDHYLDMQRQNCPFGALLIKALGMYLPGSYVRLANGELAVVTEHTAQANRPKVVSLVGKNGLPLSIPVARDTELPMYAVEDSASPDQIKVRLNPARILTRH